MLNFALGPVMSSDLVLKVGSEQTPYFRTPEFSKITLENEKLMKEMLFAATKALKPGGRLVVITYHSLEDRMVKNIMKTGNIEGKAEQDFFGNVQTPFKLVNNKVIVAGNEEVTRNPRSRSAKLRIAEKR